MSNNSDSVTKYLNLDYSKTPSFLSASQKIEGIHSGYDVYKSEKAEIPKLIDPFLQKVGVASLVGSSDTGKSSLLRQLALSIVLKKKQFLGYKINVDSGNVIYVSTEDEFYSTKGSITKQLSELAINDDEMESLKNLFFVFEFDYLLERLEFILGMTKIDLIVIDSFADVFTGEINSNTKVREFLNQYNRLGIKYGCLILFLHHIGKRTDKYKPSKDNIIGSQGFEAKMRSVLEIRKGKVKNERLFTILKCNFLSQKHKEKSDILYFNENLIFKQTNRTVFIESQEKRDNKISKGKDPNIIKAVMKFYRMKNAKGRNLPIRMISKELEEMEIIVSKSMVSNIIKDNS